MRRIGIFSGSIFLLFVLATVSLARTDELAVRSVKDGVTKIDFREPYSQMCAANEGRFLILQFKQARKLLLFDIEKAEVVKTMDCPADDVIVAASIDKMVLVVPGQQLIHRYSLPEFAREKTTAWKENTAPQLAVMGCSSKGPLALRGSGPFQLWDLEKLEPISLRGDAPLPNDGRIGMSASADGQTFCAWGGGSSSKTIYAFRLHGDVLSKIETSVHAGTSTITRPNANASQYFIQGHLADESLHPIAAGNFKDMVLQPTEDPRYFVGATSAAKKDKDREGGRIWICSAGSLEKIASVQGGGIIRNSSSGGFDGYIGNESRVRYLPRANVIAAMPKGDQQMRVIPAILPDLLKEQEGNYLHLISIPPRTAAVGKQFVYQLEVLSNQSSVAYRVESGPDGLAIDENGKVVWTPSARPASGVESIVISARGQSGKEAFQSFTVNVEADSAGAIATQAHEAAPENSPHAGPRQDQHLAVAGRSAKNAVPANSKKLPAVDRSASAEADNLYSRATDNSVVTVDFSEPYSQVCAAGGGRYLIFQLKQAKKLLLFDIVKGEIIKTMECPSDDVLIAAGVDKMVLVIPGTKLVHQYSVPELSRTKTATWNEQTAPRIALCGCNSKGPLILWGEGTVAFWDLAAMRPLTIRGERPKGESQYGFHMSVAANGQSFCSWLTGISGQQWYAYRFEGNTISSSKSPDAMNGNSWVKPNADGSLFIEGAHQLYDHKLGRIAADNFKDLSMQPTEDPRFFMALSYHGHADGEQAYVCSTKSLEKIVAINDIGNMHFTDPSGWIGYVGNESRMRFLPKEKLLATLTVGDKQVRVMPADIESLLKEKNGDYLHITSAPPETAIVGQPFTYQLEALSNLSPIEFRLENGPEDMSVTKQGKLEWTPKNRPKGGGEDVVVAARAAGSEVFQSFTISVERAANSGAELAESEGANAAHSERKANDRKREPSDSPHAPQNGPQAKSEKNRKEEKDSSDEPVQVDAHTIELAASEYQLAVGADHQSLVLLQPNRLAILESDGITIRKVQKLPKHYLRIGERAKYWVAIADKPFAVDILEKESFKVLRSVKFSAMEVVDLALHPTLPVAYVACKTSVDVPRKRFYVVNETKGEAHESPEYIGGSLQVDPAGTFLLAGFSDLYERGAQLLMNPDQWNIVPEYGNLDFLLRYDLDREGFPRFATAKDNVGGNGRGIRLSPDGKRVSYLSVVGSPAFSGNLSGWSPNDLQKVPVIYATKDKASTEHLAFHPFLPLVATFKPEQGVVLFQRETGDEVSGHVDWPSDDFKDAKLQEIYFSPDGKQLILETVVNEVHYLQAVKLKLSSKETAAVAQGLKNPIANVRTASAIEKGVSFFIKQIDALGGGYGKEMTAQDIGHDFMNCVVVVKSEGTSGSGFVVGSDGYIVTCEHCLPLNGDTQVVYRRPEASSSYTRTATIVKTDHERDLALIKIGAGKLKPVRLGSSAELESGARVTAIGNPGVADTVLDFTMTDGIVSSPQRTIEGHKFIQTSASLNPGSSGGPLFDDHGLVIGMIAAKANIEATGFAIPAGEIIDFLARSAEKPKKEIGLEREWHDDHNHFSVDAKLIAVTDDKVELLTDDGRELKIEKSRLCKADRELVDLLTPSK